MTPRPLARRALLGAALALALAGADAPAPPAAAPAPPPAAQAPAAPAAQPPAAAQPPTAPAAQPPAATAPPPQAAAKPAPPPMPQNVEALKPEDIVAVLGKKVRDPSGADMGMVVDVLVDRYGLPLGAVIDFGGFLGVGSRKIAIDWQLLQFNPQDKDAPILLSLNRAEVQAAPEYKPGAAPLPMVGPPPAEGRSTNPDASAK